MSAQELLNNVLDTVNETAELETEFRVCSPRTCSATMVKWELRGGTSPSKDGESETPWFMLDLHWELDSQEAREEMGRDKVIVLQSIFLRFLEGTHTLDPANNQGLARLLKAFGLQIVGLSNRDLFNQLIGQYGFVDVRHRTFQRSNGEQGIQAFVFSATTPE